jgi:N-acetylmuramoyl-L-alanine amidase
LNLESRTLPLAPRPSPVAPRTFRRLSAFSLVIVGAIAALAAQAPPEQSALVVIRSEGRSELPLTRTKGRPMLSLGDLGPAFQLTVREDPIAGGITVSYKGKNIVLAPNQNLASVEGRVVSLSAPTTRAGDSWLVPLDFVSRALAPIYDVPIELRPSGLVIVGKVSVPRVTVAQETAAKVSRLVLEATPSAEPTISLEGRRLIVRFAAPAIDAVVGPIKDDGYVQTVRLAQPSSLVLELGRRFSSYRASESRDGDTLEVTLDLAPSAPDTTGPTAPAPSTPTPSSPAPATPAGEPPPLLTAARGIRTIVLDPGHGGAETGARGPGGTLEKDITLAVAQQLKTLIENKLGLRVLLTRSGDETMSLDQRAAFANNNKADLFLSLHTNASTRSNVSGAEVLYLSLDEYGPEAQSAALQTADTIPALGGSTRTIAIVPWDLAQARHIDRSAQLARLVDASLRQRVSMSGRALQQAPLRVLVGANMPAVLVEMGFLSNADEERKLASKELQTNIVQALYQAIERFRAAAGARAEASGAEVMTPAADGAQDAGRPR